MNSFHSEQFLRKVDVCLESLSCGNMNRNNIFHFIDGIITFWKMSRYPKRSMMIMIPLMKYTGPMSFNEKQPYKCALYPPCLVSHILDWIFLCDDAIEEFHYETVLSSSRFQHKSIEYVQVQVVQLCFWQNVKSFPSSAKMLFFTNLCRTVLSTILD